MSFRLPQSVCVLGRQPALGLAELESLYGSGHVSSISPHAAGLDMHASEIDFARLGGSTRLAHVMADIPTTDWRTIEQRLPELLTELTLTLPDGKIRLGVSAFDLKVSPGKLRAATFTIKNTIRERVGRSVRVIPNPELELNTAQVLHNRLAGPTGIELLLIAAQGHTIVARTTDVQDIESYTLRDRGRPKRDARVGMLPPKLAQIIVNLATGPSEPSAGTIVLDPFCGTGVVLQEAALMGFDVSGTDIEQRMIDYTEINLEWLVRLPGITVRPQTHLQVGDATAHQWQPTPHFVACETYLGRPFTQRPSPDVLKQTMSDVNLILRKFLRNISGQLAPGSRLCIAVPAWQTGKDQFKFLPLIDQISELGYNRTRFEHVSDTDLLYYREDQIVARQLLVLTRK